MLLLKIHATKSCAGAAASGAGWRRGASTLFSPAPASVEDLEPPGQLQEAPGQLQGLVSSLLRVRTPLCRSSSGLDTLCPLLELRRRSAGVSLRTQELYALVFVCRYLDLLFTFISLCERLLL